MTLTGATDRIETRSCPNCPVCGSEGVSLYDAVTDPWHDDADTWSLSRCPAPQCGLLWLDPMPTERDIHKLYDENYYTKQEVSFPPRLKKFRAVLDEALDGYIHDRLGYPLPEGIHPGRARLLRSIMCLVPGGRDWARDSVCHLTAPAPGSRLLEIGFGSGRHLDRMASLGWSVTGIDADSEVVELARRRGREAYQGDLRSQEFPDASFDAIYTSHLLEHVHDPVTFLQECHRVLAPGGTLVVVTPNTASLSHSKFGSAWYLLMPPQHLSLFSPGSIQLAAVRAGFSSVSARTSARFALITWLASPWVARGFRVDPTVERRLRVRSIFRALAAATTESCLEAARRPVGEELVMLATKTR